MLWKFLEFDSQIYFKSLSTAQSVLSPRLEFLRHLSLPYALESLEAYESDSFLAGLSAANKLVWLDITGCKASSLSFLQNLIHLEVLIIDSCIHICDWDVSVIKHLKVLNQLHIGFTSVTAETIVSVLPPRIWWLECAGIFFTEDLLIALLESRRNLQHLTVSLRSSVDLLSLSERYSVSLSVLF
jgi:hypothetical protein